MVVILVSPAYALFYFGCCLGQNEIVHMLFAGCPVRCSHALARRCLVRCWSEIVVRYVPSMPGSSFCPARGSRRPLDGRVVQVVAVQEWLLRHSADEAASRPKRHVVPSRLGIGRQVVGEHRYLLVPPLLFPLAQVVASLSGGKARRAQ